MNSANVMPYSMSVLYFFVSFSLRTNTRYLAVNNQTYFKTNNRCNDNVSINPNKRDGSILKKIAHSGTSKLISCFTFRYKSALC